MKFEIRTTTRKLGSLDNNDIMKGNVDFIGVGSLIEYGNEVYCVSSIVVKKDGTIRLNV